MRETEKSRKLNSAVRVLSKIIELCCWAAGGTMAVMIGLVLAGRTDVLPKLGTDFSGAGVVIGGFGTNVVSVSGVPERADYLLCFLTVLVLCVIMALVFRKLWTLFGIIAGKTKLEATPFQPACVRLLRTVGYLLIAVSAAEAVMGLFTLEMGTVHVTVDPTTLFLGLVVLALAQFFTYGTELQSDADGLI